MERTLKLYTDPISPYSGVATLALLEKKVPYEPIHVSLKTHETKSAAHSERHPFGKIPVLETVDEQGGKMLLRESQAIARYIAEKYRAQGVSLLPPLNASSEVIGRFEEAACMERNYFTPNVWKYTSEKLIKEALGFGPPDPVELARYFKEIKKALTVLDKTLGTREYMAGPRYSLVDIYYAPWMKALFNDAGHKELLVEFPNVGDWWGKMCDRPQVQKVFELMGSGTIV